MQAKSYPDGINTNTNITMNTVRQRQRLGIKRSILTALLMGFCCLFYAPEAFSQDEPGAPSQRTAMDDDFDKSMAQARQQYGNRLYQQYMGGATTAKERAIGVLRMENAIAEAEGDASLLHDQTGTGTDLRKHTVGGSRNDNDVSRLIVC